VRVLKILKKIIFKPELKEMDLLRKRNKRLQDENDSLWDMLDEIKNSDIKNHNMSKEIDMIVERTKEKIAKSLAIAKVVSNMNKRDDH
tara:strand:+ start:561 stop:824 length:264 start_codon:yes stop_codon:yes gene_type:complete